MYKEDLTYHKTLEIGSPKKSRVLLVVAVHNRPEDLKRLLESLGRLETDTIDLRTCIVDDGSNFAIQPEIEKRFSRLEPYFIRNISPKGPAYSRNRGARVIESDYIWFLDSDTEIVNSGTLVRMIETLDSDPRVVGVGGVLEDCAGERKLLELDILGNLLFLYRPFEPNEYKQVYVDGLATANLFLRREAFEAAGGFLENLRRDEDNDMCLTLRRKGYRFCQNRETVVWHKVSNAGRKSGAFAHFADPKRYLRDLMETRTTLLARHAPWRLPVLPLFDVALAPVVLYGIKSGKYVSSRFEKAVPESRFLLMWFFIVTYIRCYFLGWELLFGKFFGGLPSRKTP